MPGQNDFIVFNQTMSNMMSQADYKTNGQVINGIPGDNVAISPLHNKLYYQLSVMAAAMGKFVADANFNAPDTDPVLLSQNIKNAIAVNIPNATELIRGTVLIVSNADMATGTDDTKAITVKKLKDNAQSVLPIATTAQKGIAQLATPAEAQAGTDQNKIITPYTLSQVGGAHIPDATYVVKGKARLSTQAEVNAGTSTDTIVTPATLKSAMSVLISDASESVKGIAMIANNTDMTAGVNDTRIVTPKKLKDNVASLIPYATTSTSGLVMLATQAEVTTGSNSTKAVTPQAVAVKAPIASPNFTGNPNTQGKFTNTFVDTVYAQGMFRNIWIYQSNPPPNTVGINGDICFLRP